MKVLGIETSCDETAAAVVGDGRKILSNVVSSQIKAHRPYGGVVPDIAAREHVRAINAVAGQALAEAGLALSQVDGVAVTYGPGLAGCLLTGLATAKSLAYAVQKPLIGVNHLEGHLFAAFLEKETPSFPFLCLIVSGGHTSLVEARQPGDYRTLGSTRDDAAGEAFDKVAKLLDLGYPGGPAIDKISAQGDPDAFKFPLAKMKDKSLDFSFSGLKTAVLEKVKSLQRERKKIPVAGLAASFQKAVVAALLRRVRQGIELKGTRQVVVGGGVAANSLLRREFERAAGVEGWRVFLPSRALCTDNAAMIAAAGSHWLKLGKRSEWELTAAPGLAFGGGA